MATTQKVCAVMREKMLRVSRTKWTAGTFAVSKRDDGAVEVHYITGGYAHLMERAAQRIATCAEALRGAGFTVEVETDGRTLAAR